jgi:hypothetical protein
MASTTASPKLYLARKIGRRYLLLARLPLDLRIATSTPPSQEPVPVDVIAWDARQGLQDRVQATPFCPEALWAMRSRTPSGGSLAGSWAALQAMAATTTVRSVMWAIKLGR